MSPAWCGVLEGLELVLIVEHGAELMDILQPLQYMTCMYRTLFQPPYVSSHMTTHIPIFLPSPYFLLPTNPPFPPSAGLNDLYSATHKNLGTETKLRQQLEQELEMKKSIRQEKEVSYSFFPVIGILLLEHYRTLAIPTLV